MRDKERLVKPTISENRSENKALTIEIVRMLYESSTRSFIVATLIAVTFFVVQQSVVSDTLLSIWSAIFILVYGGRYLISLAYHRQVDSDENALMWLNRFRYSTAVCGATWGLASLIFYEQSMGTINQAFVIVVLIGVSGGAIVTYYIDSLSVKLFVGSMYVLALPSFFLPATPFSISLATMLILYIIYVSISGEALARKVRENILMRITSHKQEEEIKALAERQQLHVDLTPMGVIEWDSDFKVISWNNAAEDIFHYSAEQAMGMHINTITPLDKRVAASGVMLDLFKDGDTQSYHDENLRQDGKVIYCEWIYTLLKDKNNQVIGLASLVQDKTEFKKSQDDIHFLAYYDSLTNLPNRRLLLTKLEQAILASQRSKEYCSALFIDLDNFKNLNDLHGHDVGDLLLQEVTNRLKGLLRAEDILSRFAGDEFVIIIENLGLSLEQAMSANQIVVDKIMATLNQVYLLGEFEHRTSSSIGICMFQGNELSSNEIIKRADIAMFQAKKAGRNAMQYYDAELQPKLEFRASLASDLRGAEFNVELVPYYQAQVNHHNEVVGAELLLRWIHPQHGFIPPDEFIPLAEESNLINTIGLSILRHACDQITLWQSQELTKQLRLSINISARQFDQDNFVEEVRQILSETNCAPHLLRLELTESLMQQNIDDLVYKMNQLKRIGVSLSLDDFGTGYSSLSSLRNFPLDELKIDRCFVNGILNNKSDASITEMIIEISKKLGIEVIAEGVETIEQENFLRKAGCLFYQGYKYGRPVPLELFQEQLESERVAG